MIKCRKISDHSDKGEGISHDFREDSQKLTHLQLNTLIPVKNKEKDKQNRGSFSHIHSKNKVALLGTKNVPEDVSFFKRRTMTYHSHLKQFLKTKKKRTNSKESRRSRKMSNPFDPISSRLHSSSSSTSEDHRNIEFHIVSDLGESKCYTTHKAVSLTSGKPIVVKIFKVLFLSH